MIEFDHMILAEQGCVELDRKLRERTRHEDESGTITTTGRNSSDNEHSNGLDRESRMTRERQFGFGSVTTTNPQALRSPQPCRKVILSMLEILMSDLAIVCYCTVRPR